MLSIPAFSQAYSGQISGIVTGGAGEYNATSLTPGNYSVKAEYKGFNIKKNHFGERLNGEFCFEVFNLLNHTQYGNPQFNGAGGNEPFAQTSDLGSSTQTPDIANNNPSIGSGAARTIQMGYRLIF